jgi:tetratricopeptide (TPR) repeat protein
MILEVMAEGRRVSRHDAPRPESILRGRFRIERTLGEGGFGSVFEALDQLRNARVALKTVHSHEHVLRLKREFRALAELRHPHLVELYELHGEGRDWFFTMELIDGPTLKEQLEMVVSPRSGTVTRTQTITQITEPIGVVAEFVAPRVEAAVDASALRSRANVEKLRVALAQIASGLAFLHAAGKLHLDVKHSNVLVARDGRAVLADFGLARDQASAEVLATPDEVVLFGTPLYMAPEQATGGALSPATDAYALGVLLYEALTGQLPFTGSTALVLAAKQQRPPPVRALRAEAPEDLSTLCDALLAPRPSERASIDAVLGVVGERRAVEVTSERFECVGRDEERAHLHAMLDATQAGGAPLLGVVEGPSGVGKSTLVRAFADEVRARGAVVLSARCRADEWVEFEAVDAIVDQLAALNEGVPAELGLLFPGVARSAHDEAPVGGAEARKLGFVAFRRALKALADRAPTVLWIDDAHWGDIDSGALVAEALRAPDAPAILVLFTVRSGTSAPMIDAILAATAESPPARDRIALAPLDDASARSLLDRIATNLSEEQRDSIVTSASGNPFFLAALASDDAPARGADLDAHVRARIEALDHGARELLASLCLAGRPLPRSALAQIARIDGASELRAIATLRSGRFVSVFRTAGVEHVDSWHDRVRDSALALLDAPAARDLHLRIARYLIDQREPDALALAHHLASADKPLEAARWAERAADRAAQHGAFDSAARAYERALALSCATGDLRRELLRKIGECWALAGRAAQAANAFERAADGLTTGDGLTLRERAASLFLGAGHIDRGLSLMRGVLSAVGQSMPRSRESVLVRLAVARAQLLARGLRFERASERSISWQQLVRIDALHSVAAGLSLVDTVAGAYFSSVHLLEALRVGEPRRVAIALATEQCFLAGRGGIAPRSDERAVSDQLRALADELGDRDVHARVLFARGTSAFLRASYDEAARALEGAIALWDGMANVEHERMTCEHFVLAARTWMGQHAAVERRLPEVLRRARDAGDLYAETTIETAIGHIPSLVRGEPDQAEATLTRSIDRWANEGFFVQHYDELVAHVDVDLYRDHACGARALDRIRARWPDVERSLLRQVQSIRVESDYARARAIIAALASGPRADRSALLRELASIHRSMLRQETSWAIGLGRCVGAALAMERSDRAAAIDELNRGAGSLDVANVQTYRRAALLYRAQLTGEARRVEAEREQLREQGVREPDRFATTFVPGRR